MSKQEKLAAFLRAFGYWHGSRMSMVPVSQAWSEYLNTPDDPPQPPEMPECVAKLLDSIQRFGVLVNTSDYVQQVRDHYRQPLKLEVGKVYEDEQGYLVDVVWHNTFFVDHFIGVRREGGLPRIYSGCGVCTAYCDSNIIKEAKQP